MISGSLFGGGPREKSLDEAFSTPLEYVDYGDSANSEILGIAEWGMVVDVLMASTQEWVDSGKGSPEMSQKAIQRIEDALMSVPQGDKVALLAKGFPPDPVLFYLRLKERLAEYDIASSEAIDIETEITDTKRAIFLANKAAMKVKKAQEALDQASAEEAAKLQEILRLAKLKAIKDEEAAKLQMEALAAKKIGDKETFVTKKVAIEKVVEDNSRVVETLAQKEDDLDKTKKSNAGMSPAIMIGIGLAAYLLLRGKK
jgi:hypothetical protein